MSAQLDDIREAMNDYAEQPPAQSTDEVLDDLDDLRLRIKEIIDETELPDGVTQP